METPFIGLYRVDFMFKRGDQVAKSYFHVGERCFSSAMEKIFKRLMLLNYDSFEILGVYMEEDIIIVNWGEHIAQPTCQCPFCRAKTCSPEDLMKFTCNCGKEIVVADDWEYIVCPECNEMISRDNVISSGGNDYFLVNLKNKN